MALQWLLNLSNANSFCSDVGCKTLERSGNPLDIWFLFQRIDVLIWRTWSYDATEFIVSIMRKIAKVIITLCMVCQKNSFHSRCRYIHSIQGCGCWMLTPLPVLLQRYNSRVVIYSLTCYDFWHVPVNCSYMFWYRWSCCWQVIVHGWQSRLC